jgi:hypothetical protein
MALGVRWQVAQARTLMLSGGRDFWPTGDLRGGVFPPSVALTALGQEGDRPLRAGGSGSGGRPTTLSRDVSSARKYSQLT